MRHEHVHKVNIKYHEEIEDDDENEPGTSKPDSYSTIMLSR